MQFRLLLTTLFVWVTLCHLLTAQIEVTPAGVGVITPENLISTVFLGEGVQVNEITYNGVATQVGLFTSGTADIGIERGIVMSSGAAADAATANNLGSTTTGYPTNTFTDPDLEDIANAGINDVSLYTIKFIPINDTLRFRFSFASEEYPEFACTSFNDAFGFFISGPGINGPFENNGENIALVPDPADPSGLTFTNIPVTINNVNDEGINPGPPASSCDYDYGTYYNDNSGSTTLTYDAYLDVFTAQAIVVPCEEYTIKLGICDRGDRAYDSAVFLEAKSFGTGALEVNTVTTSLDNTASEGCDPAFFQITLPNPADEPIVLDYSFFGTATQGADINVLPGSLVIPTGDSVLTIPVNPLVDSLTEGLEQICLDIQVDPCNRDTFCITITDPLIEKPDLGPDTVICAGDSVRLDATLNISLPPPPEFINNNTLLIDDHNVPFFSEIDVFGVQPPSLQEGVIKQVCIDTLLHPWVDEIDLFLVSPGGQFLELTTDNGANGNHYLGTCFSPTATLPINAPGPFAPADSTPFTGNYQPEGVWSDLYGDENPTNGTWQLQIVDDVSFIDGELVQWSICFNPVYDVFYEWQPDSTLSCLDCPTPTASPDTTTTYIVRAYDSYGCENFDTITVTVDNTNAPSIDSVSISPASCPGLADGTITVQASGPGTPFSFILVGQETNSTGLFDSLPAGLFELEVAGASGCRSTLPVEVPAADSLVVQTQTLQNVSCFGANDGQAEITVIGGTPGYSYLWNNNNPNALADNLSAGIAQVTVTDQNGCTAVDTAIIQQPDSLAMTLQTDSVECFGDSSGQAAAMVTGGTNPYTYAWSQGTGGLSDTVTSQLSAGPISLVVTDANGCTVSDSAQIESFPLLQLVLLSDSTSCFGSDDGQVSAQVNGGAGPYQFQWSNGASEDSVSNLTTGVYALTLSDQKGCSQVDSVAVGQPDSLQLLSLTTDSTSCFNTSDGQAMLSVSGGTPGYQFSWSDAGADTSARNDLAAGDYQVTVIDNANCEQTYSLTIFAPDSLQILITSSDASCAGVPDGNASAQVTGGTGPYNYQWNGTPSPGDSIFGLTTGNYLLEVTDANSCLQAASFSINAPDSIALTLVANPVSCFGGADGSAAVTAQGGTPPYSVLWNNGTTTDTALNLTAGSAFVQVTDQNGCLTIDSIEIIQPDSLINLLNTSDILCFGDSTGMVSAQTSGGTPPYDYTWSNGSSGPIDQLAMLPAGDNYQVTLTDANGCTLEQSFSLTQPDSALSIQLDTLIDVACQGGNTGSIAILANGGTPGYSYNWSNNGTTPTLANLSEGTYDLTVTDQNSCSQTISYSISAPPLLELQLEPNGLMAVGCFGEATGGIDVGVIGGTPPYSYNWSNAVTNQDLDNVTAGDYTLTVTDANDCTVSNTYSITQPDSLQLSLSIDSVNCFGGNDGSIDLSVDGGTLPYQYNWVGNGVQAGQEDQTNLAAGSYELTLTDNNGCSLSTQIEVTQPAEAVLVTISQPDTICFGAANGTATASVSGGTGPYAYSWSNGQQTATVTDLPAGDFSVVVTDAGGCTYSTSSSIPEYGLINAELSSTPPLCHDGQDGTGTIVTAFYGNQAAPLSLFSFAWSTQPPGTGQTIDNLMGGQDYTVTLTNTAGCSGTASISIDNPAPIGVNELQNEGVSCFGGADGISTVQGVGGTGNYTYQWSASASGQGSATAQQLPPGPHQVTVTDENGCSSTGNILIEQPTPLAFSQIQVDEVRCFGESSGSAFVTAEGGTPNYTINWSNGATGTSVENLAAGLYALTLTDQKGCSLFDTVEVTQPERPLEGNAVATDALCFDSEDGSILISAQGGTPGYTFSLNGSDFNSISSFQRLVPGVYSNIQIRDSRGCLNTLPPVTIGGPDELLLDLGPDLTLSPGETVTLNPDIQNAQGVLQYFWNSSGNLDCNQPPPFCSNPEVSPEVRTIYALEIEDENGCTAFDELVISISQGKEFFVPTGFTPNNDGFNDQLITHGREGILVVSWKIYDRWGELVYEQTNFPAQAPAEGWDGNYLNKAMPAGTYLWYADLVFPDGITKTVGGQTELIR